MNASLPRRVLQLYNVLGATTERVMLDVPQGLARRGWSPTFTYETPAPDAAMLPRPRHQLPRVAVDPTSDPAAQMDRLATEPVDSGRAALLAEPFALVHGHFGPRLLHAVPWLMRRVPVVISLYGYDTSRLLRDPAWAGRYAWAARHGVRFVALSDAMARTLADCGVPHERITVIRLGIRLTDWPYAPQPAPARPRFVFIGRLTGKKAPIDAVRAAAAIPDARLDLIGGGPLHDEIHAHLIRHGLTDRIRLLGPRPLAELPTLLDDATGFVLPSVVAPDGDAEGMPMILMQAQARGTPALTTRHAGNPETLPPALRAEQVTAEEDHAALSHAMRRLIEISAPERRHRQDTARDHIVQHFDLNRTLDAYEAIYRELVGA